MSEERDTFIKNVDLMGKKIVPTVVPSKDVGIDVDNEFMEDVVWAGMSGKLDLNAIESFTNISRSRDSICDLLDMMMQDSTMASVLETYAEDTTEYNSEGRIVWAECDDPNTLKLIEYLLDTMSVDKHIYSWAHCLIKYGDVYLKLYRKSDEEEAKIDHDTKDILTEGVVAQAHKPEDKYTGYVEMVKNPSEVFELVKLGKTRGYIKTNIQEYSNQFVSDKQVFNTYYQTYRFNDKDVEVYAADDFVHGYLEDNSGRTEERVNIFYDIDEEKTDGTSKKFSADTDSGNGYSFNVRRGQSLFYNAFKAWRELSLIQNSILLNRVTKSAIVRIINVQVGDMPKEQIGPHLQGIKSMIEQKAAINAAKSIAEYTNPGPIENNIYVPVHGEVGAITADQLGGDVNMGELTDLDHFQDVLFGSLRVPKQYFGLTDDNTGFNGGTSLSLISSRYAKTIKRIQNSLMQMITDLINLMLIDRGFDNAVNTFTIKMQYPTTQEEIDRRDNEASKVNMIRDIMDLVGDIETPATKLEILKSLLSNVITDTDVLQLVQEEIDKLVEENEGGGETAEGGGEDEFTFGGSGAEEEEVFGGLPTPEEAGMPEDNAELGGGAGGEEAGGEEPTESVNFSNNEGELLMETEDDNHLPTPAELGVDMAI